MSKPFKELVIPELLVHCFQFLGIQDISRLRLVSKSFRDVCNTDYIWKVLCYELGFPLDINIEVQKTPPVGKTWKNLYRILKSKCTMVVYKNGSFSLNSTIISTIRKIKPDFEMNDMNKFDKQLNEEGKFTIVQNTSLIDCLKVDFELDKEGIWSDITCSSDVLSMEDIPCNDKTFDVFILNDDHHSFTEVIFQLRLATKMSFDEANRISWKAHASGKCLCFRGELEECKKVEESLKSIDLGVIVKESCTNELEILRKYFKTRMYKQYEEELAKEAMDTKGEKQSYTVIMFRDTVHDVHEIIRDVMAAAKKRQDDQASLMKYTRMCLILQICASAPVHVGSKEECEDIVKYLNDKLYDVQIQPSKVLNDIYENEIMTFLDEGRMDVLFNEEEGQNQEGEQQQEEFEEGDAEEGDFERGDAEEGDYDEERERDIFSEEEDSDEGEY